ncbi:MAG: MlaD family protein [Thiohalospira sp.]
MEARLNHLIAGVFVLAFGVAIIAAGIWLAADRDPADHRTYRLYIETAAPGLERNAAVTYRGIDVGRVDAVDIDPDDPSRVRADLRVRGDVPVRSGTTATLRSQGLTGGATLALSGPEPDAPALPVPDGEPYPVIPYKPSFWSQMDRELEATLDSFRDLMGDLRAVADADNRAALGDSLAHLEAVTATLAAGDDDLRAGIRAGRELLEGSARDVPPTLERMRKGAAAAERAGDAVTDLAARGESGMERLEGRSLPRLEALAAELRRLAEDLGRLSRQLEDEPAGLLHGRQDRPANRDRR